MSSIQNMKNEIEEADPNEQSVAIFNPMTEENYRLINQAGLFVRVPPKTSLESWVNNKFSGKTGIAVLIKMLIPNRMREECLVHLNKSNINHLTLFPDLQGASEHANLQTTITTYDSLGII